MKAQNRFQFSTTAAADFSRAALTSLINHDISRHKRSTGKWFLALAACAVLGFAAPVLADDGKPGVDPQADAWLKRMGDYLGDAKFFSVNAEVWQDVQLADGQRVQAGRTIDLQVRRPDRLRAVIHSTRRNRELVYDGEDLTLCNHVEKFYGTAHTGGSLDEAMDTASEKFGITLPLEDFIRSNPHQDFLAKVTSGTDIGPATVLGTPCEHLAFRQENIDWQVWVEAGAKPVPRKFVITYKDEPDSPQYTAIFSNWDFTTPLPDFVFKFEPPPDAAKIKVREIKAGIEAAKSEKKEAK
jgi:hypothetical protein